MLEDLKSRLDFAAERLDDLVDKVEDQLDDFGEEAEELWQKSRVRITALGDKLKDASAKTIASIDAKTDEAELQAHLAAMEAREQWDNVAELVAQFAQDAKREAGSELDHAKVQAHLARLEAADFMAEQGHKISAEFQQSKAKVENASMKAAAELSEKFTGIISSLTR